jgi:predicted metal-dependent RNase
VEAHAALTGKAQRRGRGQVAQIEQPALQAGLLENIAQKIHRRIVTCLDPQVRMDMNSELEAIHGTKACP